MGPLLVRGMMWVPLGGGRVGPLLVRGTVWVPLGEGRVGPPLKKMKINKICCHGTAVQSHIINIIIAVPWVGQYGEIFSSRVAVLARPQGGTIHNLRTEYFPSQSCNNIYIW